MRLGRYGQRGVLLASLGWAGAARGAGEDPVDLAWSAPVDGSCPDAEYVSSEVRRRVGPARADRPTIRASVAIRASSSTAAAHFQMVLRTEQGEARGERVLEDESCRAVADAAAVVLAWMVDPSAAADERRDAPAVPSPPEKPAPSAPAVAPMPPEGLAPFVGIAMSVDAGTVPTAAPGGELHAGAGWGVFRWAAYGALWPTSSKTVATLADGRDVGGSFRLLAFGARACIEPPIFSGSHRPHLFFCAGPEVDSMRGRGFGVTVPSEGTKIWLSASGGLEGSLALGGPFRLGLAAFAVVPSIRERFALEGVGEVHRPGAVAWRGALGFEWVP
jgi:hypothetical protein